MAARCTTAKCQRGEVRRDFIHSHGIVLHALGRVGNSADRRQRDPGGLGAARSRKLRGAGLAPRQRRAWEGRATAGRQVSQDRPPTCC